MADSSIPTCTPSGLNQEIETASSIEELREIGVKMLDMVAFALEADSDIKSLVHHISQLNSAITLRLIGLLAGSEGVRLPEGAAFLALGSEGRGEQTLRTDQDSAIVYADDLSPDKLREVERFAVRFVDALEEIGVPRCPGNIMASNPQWRHSLSEWQQLFDQWITEPTPENMLNFGMFQDLRPLYGNEGLGDQLRDHVRAAVFRSSLFFPNMACHAVRFPPPFTIFGRIRVERNGENKGKVDIKKAGIFAITLGTSLLALENGVIGGSTWEKLAILGNARVFTAGDLKRIEDAYTYLIRLRLQWQLRQLRARRKSSNHIDLKLMSDMERRHLRQALKGVNCFLRIINNHYKLSYISS